MGEPARAQKALEDLANLARWARDAVELLKEFHRAAPFGSGKRAGELVDAMPKIGR